MPCSVSCASTTRSKSVARFCKSKEGWSREVWGEIAGLGVTAINVPEEHGGLGGGPVETMLVMNALGEGLVLEPYLERGGA